MKITIGTTGNLTELVSTQARNNTGSPVGPDKLRIADTPGIVKREYIGKDRIEPEDVKVHSGVCTFDVHREFASVGAALTYATVTLLNEQTEGALTVIDDDGNENLVFAKAAVTNRTAALVGCTVAVSYTVEG